MPYMIILALLTALTWAGSAIALEADQVRGEIVEVTADEERLRLRVEESGDQRQARPGTVARYRIAADTRVQMEDPRETLLEPTVEDLGEGDEVILDFENVGGEMVARNVRTTTSGATGGDQRAGATGTSEGTRQLAQRDDTGQRSRLPATASLLPLLALGGGAFALLALGIRLLRRR